jgi:hypothetical protein
VWNEGWPLRLLWTTGSALLLFLVFAIHVAYLRQTLLATRNFYGSLRVQQTVTDHGDTMRKLVNGSIEHGTQIFSADLRHVPTTYYAHDSGVGLALDNCCAGGSKRVGVIGLGAGTLAAYGRAGDSFRFYELNPAVPPIARNLFGWLKESPAQSSVVEGDGRASLAQEQPQHFNVLVVDAFTGDAIPLHLLTREAFALYERHMAPGGVMAFHVSNSYVNLAPEVALLAQSSGWQARLVTSAEDRQSGEQKAVWVLVARKPAWFEQGALAGRTAAITPVAGLRAWTDDYSSLLPILRW